MELHSLFITPDTARSLLTKVHPEHQRRLSKHVVHDYRTQMLSGAWRQNTPEPLVFDTAGRLIQGQHRLHALAGTNLPGLSFTVLYGADPDHFRVLDTGFKRQAAHLISDKYAPQIAAAARYLLGISGVVPPSMMHGGVYAYRIGNEAVLNTVDEWRKELTEYAIDADRVYKPTRISQPAHLAVLAQAARAGHRHILPQWVHGLQTGLDLDSTDPRWLLRQRFAVHSRTINRDKREQYVLIVKAFNAYATGGPVSILRYNPNEQVPAITSGR